MAQLGEVSDLLDQPDSGRTPSSSGGGSSLPAGGATTSWGSPGAAVSSEKLYVRVGQPVEGCDLEPFATLVLRGQQVGGPGASLSFRWSRTTTPAFPCAYSRCKLNEAAMSAPSSSESSAPGAKSLAAAVRTTLAERRAAGAQGAALPLQCLTCLRAGSTTEVQSVFCSSACLSKGWKEHSQYHEKQAAALRAQGGGSAAAAAASAAAAAAAAAAGGQGGDPLDKDDTLFQQPLALAAVDLQRGAAAATAAAAAATKAGGGAAKPKAGGSAAASAPAVTVGASVAFPPYSPEEWVVVSTERIFLPGALDVGHRLRLEVTARAAGSAAASATASAASSERAVVQVAETAPVLPRPPAATSRRFVLSPDVQPPPAITDRGEREAWYQRARRVGLRNEKGGTALRVCCWNILAEIYATASQVSGGREGGGCLSLSAPLLRLTHAHAHTHLHHHLHSTLTCLCGN